MESNSTEIMMRQTELLLSLKDNLVNLSENQKQNNIDIKGMKDRLLIVEDTLLKNVYINSGQKKHITNHVKDVVKNIVKDRHLDYKTASRILFNALWSDINDQYNVTTYHELPSVFYKEIIHKIQDWQPTATIMNRIFEAA